jgi:hypothetical protein
MKKIQLTVAFFTAITFLFSTVKAQDDNRRVEDISDGIFATEDASRILRVTNEKTAGSDSLSAVFIVNDSGDAPDAVPGDGICETSVGSGICTLRAAIGEANALAGDDTIIFDPSVTLIPVSGQIQITSNLTIIGNGADKLTIQNAAAQSTTSRIFNATNFAVHISGVTLTGGNVTGAGGAILSTGNLTITNSVIANNSATGVGGGIRSTNNLTVHNSVITGNSSTASTSGGISFAGSNLTITNTAISNNVSSGNGGGMNISATASATISNSTISGNIAGASSGGFFLNRGTITNTTISGNTANGAEANGGGGGRIQAGANSVSFISCTITNNTAPNAAGGARSGIWHETGTLNIANSIVAANVTQDIQFDGGTLVSGGFNLIGENTSVAAVFPDGAPNANGDYVGTDASPIDPLIGPLADNGGATETHALLEKSPAIDKGSALGLSADQRGFIRTVDVPTVPDAPGGDGTDIGAFEFQSTPNTAGFSVSGKVLDNAGRGLSRAMVVLTDGDGNSRAAMTNSFGNFVFDDVTAGESFIVTVENKIYRFGPQVITVNENISGLQIAALP